MVERMRELADQIIDLQGQLDREIHKRRDALGWRVQKGLVEFDSDTVARHRRLRMGALQYVLERSASELITAPVIYSMIIPLLILDLWVTVYQAICFRAYRIPRVRRSDFIALDAHHLRYLNWIEKMNCNYCSYANGVVAYAREIASRTEQYWCPIKHAFKISKPHERYQAFLEYGDAEGYRSRVVEFRERLREN
jgi:hypothetical protein